MNLSRLLQTPLNELEAYISELEQNSPLDWAVSRIVAGILDIQRNVTLIPDGYSVGEANEVAIHNLIYLLHTKRININEFNWAFSTATQPITSEGCCLFWYNMSGEDFHYMILDPTAASDLLRYLEDLEDSEDLSERECDYSLYGSCHDRTSEFREYLISIGLALSCQEIVIPPNSDSLLIREDTSRFSSATWYQAIQDKVITLAGVGGIGSYVGFLLARVHPKSIFIYDNDIVEFANMSGQLYSKSDIDMPKVEALANMVGNYANYESMFAINGRFTEESEASDIMICGFDNMEARKLFFKKWTEHVYGLSEEDRKRCLFIDGRLAAEELQVFAITGDNTWAIDEYRSKFLFSDAEADETICSYKQTTYMANLIGSLIVNVFVNFVANEVSGWDERDVPFLTSYDGLTMFFKTKK